MKHLFLITLGLTLSALGIDKPNIIIFYVDDLGWQDVEQLNDVDDPCAFDTPNLVKLAERGMNFSQAYSPAPTCAPSRAAILSGLHPARTDYTHVTGASIPDQKKDNEFQEPLLGAYYDLSHPTIADVLAADGYTTLHSGKWHIGLNSSAYGFQHFNQSRGTHSGMGDRRKDFATADDKQFPLSKEKYAPFSDKFPDGISYPYDEVTESAIQFVQEHKEKPFFLNLCHWMVHWPALTRNGELLEYYCDKMGQPFPPAKGEMTKEGQNNPYFAAMVTTVDWSLGKIMTMLETTDDPRHPGKKLVDTTYLFFTSDNGGALLKGKEILSSNAPLKHGKKRVDEGGIRVPMVIAGPGIAGGSQSDALINQLDFFPSILEMTSAPFAAESAAKLDGLDITPLLLGESDQVTTAEGTPRESLFWHFPHNAMKAALRKGDFKLYRNFTTQDYSLYRLYKDGKRADLEELKDIAAEDAYKAIKEEMIAELNAELEAHDAELPYRNPKFRGAKLPQAKIKEITFTDTATLTLSPDGAKATKAYALYYNGKDEDTNKREKKIYDFHKNGDPAIGYRVKQPVEVSADGLTLTAQVPAEVTKVQFIVIDESYYCHFSEIIEK